MLSKIVRRVGPVVFVLLIGAAVVYLYAVSNAGDDDLQASGTVEVVELTIAPEVPGRVIEVLVEEGDAVEAGQVLVRLDGELLAAQRTRVEAAIQAAQAAFYAAQAQVAAARHNRWLPPHRLQITPGVLPSPVNLMSQPGISPISIN
jgi:multidrug resistance efflux pump